TPERQIAPADPRSGRESQVAPRFGITDGPLEDGVGSSELARLRQRGREIDRRRHASWLIARYQLDRAAEEADRGVDVEALPGARSRREEVRAGPLGEPPAEFGVAADLREVGVRLLEVEPDQLLLFRCERFEPVRESLMELCTQDLRRPVVGRVSDHQVAEGERLDPRHVAPLRPDELLAYERGEIGRDVVVRKELQGV